MRRRNEGASIFDLELDEAEKARVVTLLKKAHRAIAEECRSIRYDLFSESHIYIISLQVRKFRDERYTFTWFILGNLAASGIARPFLREGAPQIIQKGAVPEIRNSVSSMLFCHCCCNGIVSYSTVSPLLQGVLPVRPRVVCYKRHIKDACFHHALLIV